MSKPERIPEEVVEIINNLEEENGRKLSKAKTRFLRKVVEILEHHGETVPQFGLKRTAKIPVENSGTTYCFWLEGDISRPEENARFLIGPDDDSMCYQVFGINKIVGIGRTICSRSGDVQTLAGFSKLNVVLDFLEGKLKELEETATQS